MKKNRKTDLLSAIIGILGCLMMAGVLMVTVHATKTNAEKNYAPEHDPRPEGVPDYVVWDSETGEKLDKDRFRRDMGGVEEAYQEIMKRLKENA